MHNCVRKVMTHVEYMRANACTHNWCPFLLIRNAWIGCVTLPFLSNSSSKGPTAPALVYFIYGTYIIVNIVVMSVLATATSQLYICASYGLTISVSGSASRCSIAKLSARDATDIEPAMSAMCSSGVELSIAFCLFAVVCVVAAYHCLIVAVAWVLAPKKRHQCDIQSCVKARHTVTERWG